jgi:hypothetical protein
MSLHALTHSANEVRNGCEGQGGNSGEMAKEAASLGDGSNGDSSPAQSIGIPVLNDGNGTPVHKRGQRKLHAGSHGQSRGWEYFPMCINSMAQLLGILAGRDLIPHAFLQAFLVNDQVSVADHLQKYVRLLVMPKVPKRAFFGAC